MKILPLYTLYFFVYGFIGWILESSYCTVGESRRAKKLVFVNRGFLTGPIVPIYAVAALGMIITLSPFATSYKNIPLVFFLGMVVCDVIEYFTSYIMEKIFNQRWWDYSNNFMNLHGRICLKHTIMWGFLSTGFIYLIHSQIAKLVAMIPAQKANILLSFLLVIFFVDFLNTVSAAIDINKLSMKAKNLIASVSNPPEWVSNITDNRLPTWRTKVLEQIDELTEQIKTESVGNIRKNKVVHRILREFPSLRESLKNQSERLSEIRDEIKDRFSSNDDSNEMF